MDCSGITQLFALGKIDWPGFSTAASIRIPKGPSGEKRESEGTKEKQLLQRLDKGVGWSVARQLGCAALIGIAFCRLHCWDFLCSPAQLRSAGGPDFLLHLCINRHIPSQAVLTKLEKPLSKAVSRRGTSKHLRHARLLQPAQHFQ